MKTLQELKDEVSRKWTSKNYDDISSDDARVNMAFKVTIMGEAAELYASQFQEQLSALQQENETLKATFEEFKRGIAKGSELYAHLKFDDQEFTPYQLALQENEKLRERLKKYEPCPF